MLTCIFGVSDSIKVVAHAPVVVLCDITCGVLSMIAPSRWFKCQRAHLLARYYHSNSRRWDRRQHSNLFSGNQSDITYIRGLIWLEKLARAAVVYRTIISISWLSQNNGLCHFFPFFFPHQKTEPNTDFIVLIKNFISGLELDDLLEDAVNIMSLFKADTFFLMILAIIYLWFFFRCGSGWAPDGNSSNRGSQ